MAELNYPDPAVTNPWVDPSGQSWTNDGDGWGRTSAAAASPTGYKNVIINGRLGAVTDPWIINQRGFDGDWDALPYGDYGYDRWFAVTNFVQQLIEATSVVIGRDYVLSWEGGGFGYIVNAVDTTIVSGESPVTVTLPSFGSHLGVLMPTGYETNVQLELGTVPTAFEVRPVGLELMLCERYYWDGISNENNIDLVPIAPNPTAGIAANRRVGTVHYPVSMRIPPNIVSLAFSNGSLESQLIASDYVRFAVQTASDAQPSVITRAIFDAEIT